VVGGLVSPATRDLLPNVTRIAALTEEANVSGPRQMAVLVAAARAGSIEVVPLSVAAPGDMERAFDAARDARVDAMVVLSSALFAAEKRRIIELAARARLPTVYEHRDFTENGGLVSYGPDLRAVFRRAAVFVDRILKGAAPGDLPIEQPTNFELVINLRTAAALGLAVPPPLIARADEVIE
jgi:putative ABC transport system substrate-binding protein